MGNQVTRNSLKGMTYQENVFRLFVGIMDCNRDIYEIKTEVSAEHNFDDIEIIGKDNLTYFVQIKNYQNTNANHIKISSSVVTIKGKKIKKSKEGQNVIVINSPLDNSCNHDFYGIPCIKKSDIIVIPLSPERIIDYSISIYQSIIRSNTISNLIDQRISSGLFTIKINDLPELETYSTKIEGQLTCLNEIKDFNSSGIVCYIGKPGVGKSFFASEIEQKYPDLILYRFWTDAQDYNLIHRLQFDNFINDLAIKLIGSPRKFNIDELINRIIISNKLYVFDGLDHVSNYNHNEFDKYIDFFNRINKANVIILTREVSGLPDWDIRILHDWNKEQTYNYLVNNQITDHSIIERIFSLTGGYPIITSFLTKHFNLFGELNIDTPISSINEYYERIIKDVKTISALSIILLSSKFITKAGIEKLTENEYSLVIFEFTRDYPYLFELKFNRISLIHDSLNTFLRNRDLLKDGSKRKYYQIIEKSILNEETEYLSRFDSFDFNDEFIQNVLLHYSNILVFKRIMSKNIDFESVKEFYQILKIELERFRNVLSINQYYSFILICNIFDRNNLNGNECLLKNHADYLIKRGVGPDKINSSGLFWDIYSYSLLSNVDNKSEFLGNIQYLDTFKNDEIEDKLSSEINFFDCIKYQFDYSKAISYISSDSYYLGKKDNIIDLLINIYMFGCENNELDEHVKKIVIEKGGVNHENYILRFCYDLNIDTYLKNSIILAFKEKLVCLGIWENFNNSYNSIGELVQNKAIFGSWEVSNIVNNTLRLLNHINNDIDISEMWKVYFMYNFRKDYSVITLPLSLVVFEKVDFIDEIESINILINIMNQSEKGISHLLDDYSNLKDDNFIERVLNNERYTKCKYLDLLDLLPSKIDKFSEKYISRALNDLLTYHNYSKVIEYFEIKNILNSKYKDKAIKELKNGEFKISNVPLNEVEILKQNEIEFFEEESEIRKRDALENGILTKDDVSFIIESKMDALDIAKYPGDWLECLPLIDIYENFDYDFIKFNLLEIIHNSLYAKSNYSNRIGTWNNYLGYIPELLYKYNYQVDWTELYNTFELFLEYSSALNMD